MLTPDDEITSGEDMIGLDEVRARIAVLKPFHVEDEARVSLHAFVTQAGAQDWIAARDPAARVPYVITEYTEESDELNALTELEAEMAAMAQAHGRSDAISDRYLDAFVRNEIDDVCGSDAVAVLGPYVDWDTLTGDRKGDMTEHTFRGQLYYLTS